MQEKKRCREEESSQVKGLLLRALNVGGEARDRMGASAGHGPSLQEPEEEEEADEATLPSDLMASIMCLRAQMLMLAPSGVPPIVLRSQLCAMLKDDTCMERELDELKRKNTIRVFRVNTGPTEFAVLLAEDYKTVIREAAVQEKYTAGSAAFQASCSCVNVVESFCTRVLPCHTDMSISHQQLGHLLSVASTAPRPQPSVSMGEPNRFGKSTITERASLGKFQTAIGSRNPASPLTLDAQVTLLMQVGVLSRHPLDDGCYMLCIPGVGKLIQAICEGRREMAGLVRKVKYREVPEQQLLKGKLRRSPLGVAFHLKDMLGLGLLQRFTTAAGTFIRLAEKPK